MLGFRLGSIPIRIHPAFFLIALFVSSSLRRPDFIAVGVVVVFFAVLLHELGHAWMGMVFGLEPVIDLLGSGGLTSWSSGRNLAHWKSIFVSFAGPLIGFTALGILIIATWLGLRIPDNEHLLVAIGMFRNVTIWWGFLNLLPILPLDGGNILRSFLHIVTKGRGEKPARIISIIFAGLGVAWCVFTRNIWMGMFAGMYVYMNFQAFRAMSPSQPKGPVIKIDVEDNMQRAYSALENEDGAKAVMLLRPVLEQGVSGEKRQSVLRMFAYGLLLEGAWRELLLVLQHEKKAIGNEELERYATAAKELSRPEEAAQIEALRTA